MLPFFQARGHSGTSGLGATSQAARDILPSDSYANKVRKTMRSRFNYMQEWSLTLKSHTD